MRRLAGVDASFLYMETPTAHMHVVGTLVVDPSTATKGYSFDAVRHLLETRIHLLAPFRRRVLDVPFNMGRPVVIEDPDFNLSNHLRRIGVPPPGSLHELGEVVGDIASRPLDRSRPLWELWVVEGLEGGNVAIVSKMHHSMIDGVSGADLMVHLFDLSPDAPDPEPPAEEWKPDAVPSPFELMGGALVYRMTNPVRAARVLTRTAGSVVGAARTTLPGVLGRSDGAPRPALPFMAPNTKFNGALTPRRITAFGKAVLDDLRFIKSTYGTTVNDVVLAACSLTLRDWLIKHDDLPDQPLVAACPVSVHVEGKDVTNQVSVMFVRLPVQLEDPVEQLLAVRGDTKDAKALQGALGADMLMDLAQFVPGTLFNRAMRAYASSGLADRMRPPINLIISNIPGPPIPLYSAGAQVVGVYPFGPLLDGVPMNLTVLSNTGNIDFGIIACPDRVPNAWDIADGFSAAVALLKQAAEKEAGVTPKVPPAKKRSAKTRS